MTNLRNWITQKIRADRLKVAICFIGTNKYLDYLPRYVEQINRYFLPDCEKTIIVFTDGTVDPALQVNVYPTQHLGWPYVTLKRFQTIKQAATDISQHDWFVYIDADMLVVDKILSAEFFPDNKSLFAVHHPYHYLTGPRWPGSWESDQASLAAVSPDEDLSVYFQGCLWGGKIPAVLDMIAELDRRTEDDLSRGVIAKWHDESHLNRYLIDNRSYVHVISAEYACLESDQDIWPVKPRILHLTKDTTVLHNL